MSIQEFLKQEIACEEARSWAKGKSLQEIWQTCDNAKWLIWLLRHSHFAPRTMKELAVIFAESVTHLMQHEESKQVVIDLRRWLNGEQVDLEYVSRSSHKAYLQAMAIRNSDNGNTDAHSAFHAADAADDAVRAVMPYGSYSYINETMVGAINAMNPSFDKTLYAAHSAKYAQMIRDHITFTQVAQAAQKMGIEI